MWEKRRRTRLLRRPHLPGPQGGEDEPGLGVDRLAVLAQEGVDGGRSVAVGPGAAVPRGAGPRQQPGIAGQEDDGVVARPLLQGQAERHRGVQDLLLPLAVVLLLPSPGGEGGRGGGWESSRTVRAERLE